MNPPITWARFIMLVEAQGVKADDPIISIMWSAIDGPRRSVEVTRNSLGEAQIA